MNSETYRRASTHPQSAAVRAADSENRLLSYFPPRRLEAEELRDAILYVSGSLNPEMGGPGTFPELNADLVEQPRLIMGTVAPAWQASPTLAERNRRTIYTFQQRSVIDPLIEVFNGANMNESCEFRRASTIAPQVFSLFNSRFSQQMALAFAGRLMAEAKTAKRQIELAFEIALQRRPTAQELQMTQAHLQAMTAHHRRMPPPALPELRPVTLYITSEFTGQEIPFVEEMDFSDYERGPHASRASAETRALAEVCLVLLNTNEFVYLY